MTSSSDPAGLSLPDLAARAGGRRTARPRPMDAGEGGGWSLPSLHHDGRPEPPTDAELAYRRGLEEGRALGSAAVRRELAPALHALARVGEVLDAERANFARARERNLEALALAVAGKLVQREVEADPALVRGLVDRALAMLPLDATLEVRLHPADLALVEAARAEQEGAPSERAIAFIPDAALERGAFLLESPQRLVDGRFDVALRTLYDRLER